MALPLLSFLVTLSLFLSACSAGTSGKIDQEARSHYLLGASALAENNPTMALQEFLQAEKLDSHDPDIQAGLAQAYMQKLAYDLAEVHWQEAIELSDGAPQYYNNLGALYLSMERYDDAISAFRKAADNLLFASPEISWTGIGLAQFHKQDYAAAEQSYRKALQLNSRFAQASFRLGELYYQRDRTVEAAEAFSRAVELEPRYVDALYWLGMTAMKTGDNPLARQSFKETIKLAPDSEQARLSKGYLKTLRK